MVVNEIQETVRIQMDSIILEGDLEIPEDAQGLVIFAHGSGSSRHSIRNKTVAKMLRQNKMATLLFDLLTPKEEEIDNVTAHLRFDIDLLSERLIGTTDWVLQNPATKNLNIGYFGASTGAAAALSAASKRSDKIGAVVSRGGRPDLAEHELPNVEAPTLLIVGGKDYQVIEMNREALKTLNCKKELQIIPGATHLFEEQGALEEVAKIAGNWFLEYLVTD
ncbi:dienelactone hydrolase family protein [Methanohalophilus halophilus]|uniref:Alpha/beta hydrolase n=1 Tax=Methanohalophilus halophilus TaxID=2177 RepID=A0A1L3Q3K3_9EURY|nr:alpha/beta hydrolase [Methanohalophilus halophilus]APH39435.1 hydrolase [Methanohalophilus halophilus]RNI07724.1 alpha/beta hydrolase [Methanohalophilus halophilus]SDW97681.1 Alpha/beta hydrolase family protein [Methanohalophilus halophilus]